MTTCHSCQYSGQDTDGNLVGAGICGIDRKVLIDQIWKICNRYEREPGADEHENDIESELIECFSGHEFEKVEIK